MADAESSRGVALPLPGIRSMTSYFETDADRFIPLKPVVFEIIVTLAGEARHGYAILRDVRARSGGRVKLETGPLYRHLKRLLDDGLVEERGAPADEDSADSRRRYYGLTDLGRAVLTAEGRRLAESVEHAQALGVIPT
jgi:DNA-binding PadR family transcriptional regulator